MTIARPLSERTEAHGDVLWWRFPIEEAPWVGSPLTTGYVVQVHVRDNIEPRVLRFLGGRVRLLRDQCARNGITFHHKQNGGIRGKDSGCLVDGVEHKNFPPALAA